MNSDSAAVFKFPALSIICGDPPVPPDVWTVSNVSSRAVFDEVGIPNVGTKYSRGASRVNTLRHTSFSDSVNTRCTISARASDAARCTSLAAASRRFASFTRESHKDLRSAAFATASFKSSTRFVQSSIRPARVCTLCAAIASSYSTDDLGKRVTAIYWGSSGRAPMYSTTPMSDKFASGWVKCDLPCISPKLKLRDGSPVRCPSA